LAADESFVADAVAIHDLTGATLDVPGHEGSARAFAWIRPLPVTSDGVLGFLSMREGAAKVEIFDLSGRRMSTLLDQSHLSPGRHELTLAAGSHAPRLEA